MLRCCGIPCVQQVGYYCWFDIAKLSCNADIFCQRAAEAGVLMMPGNYFGSGNETQVRVCCTAVHFDEVLVHLEKILTVK